MTDLQQSGLNEVVEKLKKVDKNMFNEIMNEARVRAEFYARKYCPVDTGELENSIYSLNTNSGFVLGASARHAIFNEYGSMTTPVGYVTSPLPAKKTGFRPFLRPAIYRVRQEMQELFGGKLQERIG